MDKHDKNKIVFAPCRRGSDARTSGHTCDSRSAYQLTSPGSSRVSMKCAKCGHIWTVALGGSFSM